MRVLHVISRLDTGRAEHHLRLLLGRLPYECEVATLSRPGAVGSGLRAGGVRVHEIAGRGGGDLPAVLRLGRLIRTGGFDMVHTHLRRACVQGRFAARLAGVRDVVATEHSLPAVQRRPALGTGEILGRVTIAASPAIAERLRLCGVPEARIVVIPQGVDAGEFRFDPDLRASARARLSLPAGAPVIGAVGRLAPGKRFDRLIRAVAEVPDASLLLVGDGPARAALERLAEIEGVTGRIVFAGAVPHAQEMLSAMDVLVAPGADAGPVVLEALAAGLPTVYADSPPLDDLRHAGRPVPHARRLSLDPESLPRTLRAEVLCLDERRGTRLPPATVGGRYDADSTAASVGQLYERLTARRRRPSRAAVKPRAAG